MLIKHSEKQLPSDHCEGCSWVIIGTVRFESSLGFEQHMMSSEMFGGLHYVILGLFLVAQSLL